MSDGDNGILVRLEGIEKVFHRGSEEIHVLRDLHLQVPASEFLALMGPSGSGKSTLLNLIGGLDQPSLGEIFIDGTPLHGISDDELTLIRRRHVGFIFQFFNLLPILTAAENVGLPLLLEGIPFTKIKPKAEALLQKVGLRERTEHRPEQLSGGEMQRVAIARALIANPAVLLADEPTGNLDSRTSEDIFKLLSDLHHEGQTIVMVTHDLKAASHGTRVITLKDGSINEDTAMK